MFSSPIPNSPEAMDYIHRRAQMYAQTVNQKLKQNVPEFARNYVGFGIPQDALAFWGIVAAEGAALAKGLEVTAKTGDLGWLKNITKINSGVHLKYLLQGGALWVAILYASTVIGCYMNALIDYNNLVPGRPILPLGRLPVLYDYWDYQKVHTPGTGPFGPLTPMFLANIQKTTSLYGVWSTKMGELT